MDYVACLWGARSTSLWPFNERTGFCTATTAAVAVLLGSSVTLLLGSAVAFGVGQTVQHGGEESVGLRACGRAPQEAARIDGPFEAGRRPPQPPRRTAFGARQKGRHLQHTRGGVCWDPA